MSRLFTLTLLLTLLFSEATFAQQSDCDPDAPKIRYRSRDFFTTFQFIPDVIYWDNGSEQFGINIFLPPMSDTETSRPLVLWAHPGAFVNGSKDTDSANLWCETLAKMGYVCASIDYRKELLGDALNPFLGAERGSYKGIQDGRSAIRYLKANASTYGINPAEVYASGESAGGIISINVAYMENAERPSNTFGGLFRSDLGCPDCGEGALVDNSAFDGDVEGAVKLWGGVDDPNVVDGVSGSGQTDDEPCLLIHGDLDLTVTPGVGPPFQDNPLISFFLPDAFGTYPIRERLTALGNNAPNWEAHVLCREGHGLWVDKTNDNGGGNGDFGLSGIPDENFDYVMNEATDFLARTRGMLSGTSDTLSTFVNNGRGALDECDDQSIGTYIADTYNEYFVPNSTAGHTYCWDITKGIILSGQGTPSIRVRWNDTPEVAVNRTGTILCYETDMNGNIFDAATFLVTINGGSDVAPIADFTATETMPSTFDFMNTSTNAVSAEWMFGDGATSTQFSPTHTYSQSSGSFPVQLRVQNSQGAFAATTQTVMIGGNVSALAIKILLEGNYDENTQQLTPPPFPLPSTNPFDNPMMDNFGATVTPSVFMQTGTEAIVEWVSVEVKNATTTRIKAALLQSGGDVVDLDGLSVVSFDGLPSGMYQITIQQRNHLSITSTTVNID
ncbi:MAG: PKD domain-containing protein [Bacteroidota bacterium]